MTHSNSIAVPRDALFESETGRYVYIEENKIAVKKDVEILAIQEENVLVAGLAPQQNLVVLGHRTLSAGDTLRVINNKHY